MPDTTREPANRRLRQAIFVELVHRRNDLRLHGLK